jgi:PAS domain S-box-containing protein
LKPTGLYQLRSWAILIVPLLIIVWSISVVITSNQKQAELRDNVDLINSFNRIAQALDDLDDEFAAQEMKAAEAAETKRWNDLLAALRRQAAALVWSHPAAPAIRRYASRIDSLVTRMDSLYTQAPPRPNPEFRKTIRLAIDENKSALKAIRERTVAISPELTTSWLQLNLLAFVSCLLAIISGFFVMLYQSNLTRRKQVEQALGESDERHRSVIAAMTEGVVLQSADGRILTANASAEAILGSSKERREGKNLINPKWRTIHEDGSPFPSDEHPVGATLRTGKPCTNVIMGLQKPDGELRWISINTQPLIRASQEKAHAVVASFSDITGHKQAEDALRRQAQIIEQIQDAVVVTDLDGRVKLWNKGAENIFGYTAAEAIGHQASTLYALEEQANLPLREKRNPATEGWARRKSGERCFIHLSMTLLRDEHGAPYGMIGYASDLTELKRAEEALRESEARNRLIVDTAMDAIITMDAAGKITGWNAQAEATFGWTAQEVIGKPLADAIIPPEHREAHKRGLSRYLATGEARLLNRRIEMSALRRTGEIFPVELAVAAILNPNGPVTFSAFIKDIGARKHAEENLRKSEERYRTLVERMTDGVYRSTPAGKFLEVNPAMVTMLGYENKKELMDVDIKSQLYFDPKEREDMVEVLREAGKDEIEVFRLRHKNGQEVWVEDHGRLVLDAQGNVLYHEGILRDITARKKAEEALRKSEERYRTIVERMTDGVYRSTPDGKFIDVNAALVNMLGYASKKELLEVDIKTQLYFDPKEREEMIEVLREAGKDEIEVFRLRRKDGQEIWVEDHGRLVYDEQGNVLYHEGILRDITARKRAEQPQRRQKVN